jgi:hypothetical protein
MAFQAKICIFSTIQGFSTYLLLKLSLLVLLCVWPAMSLAQTKQLYFSETDSKIQPQKILVLPVQDNTNGVYSVPLTAKILQIVESENQFDVQTLKKNMKFNNLTPDFLTDSPQAVIDILLSTQTDTLLATRVSTGPKGLQGKMTLFHGKEGLPLVNAEFRDSNASALKDLEIQMGNLFQELKSQLTYQGTVVSRKGNQVTMNIGTYHGAKNDDMVSVIQLLKLQRHPRFQFMISADREVIGKIRITKVEQHLSFGQIIQEKEPLLLSIGNKVAIDRMIIYQDVIKSQSQVLEDMNNRKDSNYVFGEKPKEWEPRSLPQYGRIQLMAGFGQYSQSSALRSAGTITAGQTFAPQMLMGGEVWFNKNYFLNLEFKQSLFSVNNPLDGSAPDRLNMSVGHYHLMGIYNLPFSQEFFGPRIQFMLGTHQFTSRSDESTPITFTNMQYGGIAFGLLGAFPVTETTDVGMSLKFFWNPSVSESSTKNSGTGKPPSINLINVFGSHHYRPNLNFIGRLDLDYYSADFGANGGRRDQTTSISHKMTTLMAGIEYMF